jgi:hypothetical protein
VIAAAAQLALPTYSLAIAGPPPAP